MPVSPTIERDAGGGWLVTWSPGTAPYSVWLDGILLGTTDEEEYLIEDPDYDDVAPAVEVLNDGEVGESETYPPFVRLQWRGNQVAESYEVQQLVGVEWKQKAVVAEDGSGYYSWESLPLEDEAVEQFRVVASDVIGNEGTPVAFSIEVCRNPAPPIIAVAIDSGDVVISGS